MQHNTHLHGSTWQEYGMPESPLVCKPIGKGNLPADLQLASTELKRREATQDLWDPRPSAAARLQSSALWESTGRHACGFTMLVHAFGSASNSLHEALGTGPSLKWEHVLSGQENPTDRPAGSSPSALAIAQLLGCFFQGTIRRPRERQTQVSRKRCTHPLKQVWKGGVHVECLAHMTLSPAKRTF